MTGHMFKHPGMLRNIIDGEVGRSRSSSEYFFPDIEGCGI